MAEVKRRHRRHDSPDDREHRKRDDRRHRERSRSPHQRREGDHRGSFHGDNVRSRGGYKDRHRHQDSHEPQRRDHGRLSVDHEGRSGVDRERRKRDYDGSVEHRISGNRTEGSSNRDERFETRGGSRNGKHNVPVPHPGNDQLRERDRERGQEKERIDRRRHPRREKSEEEDISNYEYGGGVVKSAAEGSGEEAGQEPVSLDPDYALSGKLTAETNTFRGVVIKYNEPEEARIPKIRWRLYQFKGDETLPTLYIHRQSAYLVGRERKICDMPVDHPSCSKQHAVIQYRLVNYTKADGSTGRRVRPYVIDLESTNGTYVNNQRIDPARYYELKEKDMLKFGFSSREYILLHENSAGDEDDEPDPLTISHTDTEEGGGDKAESGANRESGSDGDSSPSEDEKKRKKKKKKKRSHKSHES